MELTSENDYVTVYTTDHMATLIRTFLEPFKTHLALYVDIDPALLYEQHLVFEVRAFPGRTFTYPFNRRDLIDLDDWREVTTKAFRAAQEYYQSLYTHPEDNIILGED